jgi:hypothetical protein
MKGKLAMKSQHYRVGKDLMYEATSGRCRAYTSNEELPGGMYFALLVTYLLVTRPFHNLPTGKRAHNLLQHVRAGNICTSRWVFSRFFSVHTPYW